MTSWAVCLPAAAVSALGPLRKRSEVEVCQIEDSIWLRCSQADERLLLELRSLPGIRFKVLDDKQLLPADARVPDGYLPEEHWMRLPDWLSVELPAAGFTGRLGDRSSLRLVRGGKEAKANVLATKWERWRKYALAAPASRLTPLAFALNGHGTVVLRGEPLPPLIGERFVELEGVAAPAGWQWQPAVDAYVVCELLALKPGDLALLREDGWQRLEAGDFVQATRSAVRLSEPSED